MSSNNVIRKKSKIAGGFSSLMSVLAIVISLIAGVLIYKFIFGDPANFAEGDNTGEPLDGNLLATIYKGGFIVPILVAINLIIIIFSIERFVTLSIAKGKGKSNKFVSKIKELLGSKEGRASALDECDKQRGSLANVVHEGIIKYQYVMTDSSMDKEAKVVSIQKALEEATSLELPMLSKNMVVISTMASIGTLAGLIGTVVGMIRAFAALSAAGAPDTSALATGISEALVNTLVGILTSAFAIIFYNYFSNRIDQITYAMDEAGFSIIHEFQSTGK